MNVRIDYGSEPYGGSEIPVAEFEQDCFLSVRVRQSINPLSEAVEINTCDFDLDLSEYDFPIGRTDYPFARGEKIALYKDNSLLGLFFIRSTVRKSKYRYTIQTGDYISVLDDTPFAGGFYVNATAEAIAEEISTASGVPITVDDAVTGTLTGIIEPGTCREALRQMCFALGAVADTTGRTDVLVYKLGDSETPISVPATRIMIGQTVEVNDELTAVTATVHDYAADTSAEGRVVYQSRGGQTVGTFTVRTDRPCLNYRATEGTSSYPARDVTIIDSGVFFVTFTVGPYYPRNFMIRADVYDVTEYTATLPVHSGRDFASIAEIGDAPFINSGNVDAIMAAVAAYYSSPYTVRMKVAQRRTTATGTDELTPLGARITFPTTYAGTLTGRVIAQSYDLSGNTIVKDITITTETQEG